MWTDAHTAVLKQVIARITAEVPYINFDPDEKSRLLLHTGPVGLAGVLQ